nr:hypothetical protein [Candidatus Microthrix sp.]
MFALCFWRGVSEIKARQPGMMLLISLGLIVAFVASVATQFGLIDVDLWFELATLVTVMLVGHWLEMRAVGRAQGALAALAELLPDDAERLDADGEPTTVAIAELAEDDIVLVRAGGRVPVDGRSRRAELDESMITASPAVANGRAAGSHSSILRARSTALAGIQRLVEEAQSSHSRAQAMADRFAGWLFYAAIGSGLLTFVVWMALEPAGQGR